MQYNKTIWVDHIVDGVGNVVQQGTPLSAGRLNKLEAIAKDATVLTAGELAAAAAHSGVLQWAPWLPGVFTSVPTIEDGGIMVPVSSQFKDYTNIFALRPFQALIAGQVIKIGKLGSSGWVRMDLPAPPVAGERDDFLFLEAWRDQATQDWKYRVRAHAGADFKKYPEGFRGPNQGWDNQGIMAQGGNDAPITTTSTDVNVIATMQFTKASEGLFNSSVSGDQGLFIVGKGDEASKSLLKTYDGYVYAIQLFKVARRNSGGYSVNNPNGAIDHAVVSENGTAPAAQAYNAGQTVTITMSTALPATFQVGRVLYRLGSNLLLGTIAAINGTQITITMTTSYASLGLNAQQFYVNSDRPDGLYSNIIDERDITDLRHKTFLTAPSYSQLLIEGTDKLLSGASQVERRKAMRKTYVGVKKTPIDANHIFYSSMDGSLTPEVGTQNVSGTQGFEPSPTGIGAKFSASAPSSIQIPLMGSTPITMEAFTKVNDSNGSGTRNYVLFLSSEDTSAYVAVYFDRTTGFPVLGCATTFNPVMTTVIKKPEYRFNEWNHFRLILKEGSAEFYLNGKLMTTLVGNNLNLNKFTVARFGYPVVGWSLNGVMSDLSISKVDRGAAFATLPPDFIAGYAEITPSLNYQRRINSDVLTSQKSYAVAKVKNQTQERGVTVTKGAGTSTAIWEAGDKIKVKGLAGEIISGIIDSDTALATVTATVVNNTTIPVSDTSKFAANDTVVFYDPILNVLSGTYTISSVGSGNIVLTALKSVNAGNWILETTASTSSPVVRTIVSGTSTNVPGTWSSLGTNEAEFTLSSAPDEWNIKEIIIEYSLNMPAGQGGLFQVYTNILGAEANGKKLIKGTLAVIDDFAGKVAGSTTVNPNKAYSSVGAVLPTPGAPGTEFSQAEYDAVKSLDNSLKITTASVNGNAAFNLVAVDVVKEFELKHGKILGAYTQAEKVAWLHANVGAVTVNLNGYGSGPAGNKMNARIWFKPNNDWVVTVNSHTSGTVSKLTVSRNTSNGISNYIDENGMVYVVAYTDNSDGITPATLYLDHVSFEFEIVTKAGYDTLVPENPRRDNGLAGVLYVRRQTREVESLFPGNDEDNGIAVIGEYVPTQEFSTTSLSGAADLLLWMQGFITTAGTNRAYGQIDSGYSNIIARLLGPGDDLNYKVDPQSLISTQPFNADFYAPAFRYWGVDTVYGNGGPAAGLYSDGIPSWAANASEFLVGTPALVINNGEILLRIRMRKRSQLGAVGLGGANYTYYFRLPGRPLIKL